MLSSTRYRSPFSVLRSWQFLQSKEDIDVRDNPNRRNSNLRNVYSVPYNWDKTPAVLQRLDSYLTDKYVVNAVKSIYSYEEWPNWATEFPHEAETYFGGPPYRKIPRDMLGYPDSPPDFVLPP